MKFAILATMLVASDAQMMGGMKDNMMNMTNKMDNQTAWKMQMKSFMMNLTKNMNMTDNMAMMKEMDMKKMMMPMSWGNVTDVNETQALMNFDDYHYWGLSVYARAMRNMTNVTDMYMK